MRPTRRRRTRRGAQVIPFVAVGGRRAVAPPTEAVAQDGIPYWSMEDIGDLLLRGAFPGQQLESAFRVFLDAWTLSDDDGRRELSKLAFVFTDRRRRGAALARP